MIFKVCAVFDKAAEVYAQPMFVVNVGQAVRSFGDECKRVHSDDRPNPLNLHPLDFSLYELGSYDDNTGLFDTGVPRFLASGVDYVSLK